MTKDEKLYWLGFSAFPGVGPKRFALLRKYFGSAKKAWQAKRENFLKLGFSEKLVSDFDKFREEFNLSSYSLRLENHKIKALTIEDKDYPENLKNIDGAPFLLYMMGKILTQDSLSVGVVGTRKITAYGKEVTERLVSDLVASGLTIVSGLAYGVDSIAHNTALDIGGRTIGVWAGGLDSVVPGFRQNIVGKILKSGRGAIISEFPLGLNPSRGTFPARNRLISGLSLGVLVTEAAEDSGSLITAAHAVKQGRKVFAVPGPITSPLTAGTAKLLKSGAKLVYHVKDILDELNIAHSAKCIAAKEILPDDKNEEIILNLLKNEEKHIDELVRQSGFDTAKVTSIISIMEIKGKIKNLGGMVYIINK